MARTVVSSERDFNVRSRGRLGSTFLCKQKKRQAKSLPPTYLKRDVAYYVSTLCFFPANLLLLGCAFLFCGAGFWCSGFWCFLGRSFLCRCAVIAARADQVKTVLRLERAR